MNGRRITLHVYRDLTNREVGEPDDGDFRTTLPDGSTVGVGPDSHVRIRIKDGKLIGYHTDSPPEDDGSD